MQTLKVIVVLAIVMIVFLILIYQFKGKDIFAKIIKISFRYFIYILCILAQQVDLTDGKTKKQFVVNTIKTIITKIFIKFHLPAKRIDNYIHKYFGDDFIENIVQKVYDEYVANITTIEQSLRREIMLGQEDLYKNVIKSISDFNE